MINSLGLRYICVMGFSKTELLVTHGKKVMQRSRCQSNSQLEKKLQMLISRARVETTVRTLDKRIRVLMIAGQVAITYV